MNDKFIYDPHDLSGKKEGFELRFIHYAFRSAAEEWNKTEKRWLNPVRVGFMLLAEKKGDTPERNVSITVAAASFLPGERPRDIRMTTKDADGDFVRQLIEQGFAGYVKQGVQRQQDCQGAEVEEFPWVRIDVTGFYDRYMRQHQQMAMDSPVSHVLQCRGQVMNGRDPEDYMTCRIGGIEQKPVWCGITGREFFRVAELYPDCSYQLNELATEAYGRQLDIYRQARNRVSDASVLFNKGTHYLRCRIDGQWQLMKQLDRLDICDFQISKDIHALAAKYYADTLDGGIKKALSLGR